MISIINVSTDNFHQYQGDILEIERSSFPTPWTVNAFWEEVKSPVSHLWALMMNEALIGYTCFWMFSDEIHLMNIAVHPDKRGNGIGYYILSKVMEIGMSMGVERAWLEVRPSNLMARIMYRKAGFLEIGRRPLYYKDTNEDAIVMARSFLQQEQNNTLQAQEG